MPKKVTKRTITLVRVHDSDHMAQLEADQLNENPDALDRLAPAPRTWRLTAKVTKAEAQLTASVQNKPSVKFTVEVKGAKVDIDGWVEEYQRVHTLMPTREDDAKKLDAARKAAQKKAKDDPKNA